MPHSVRQLAAFLVLGLVISSLPARVWLFGACPVCGNIHQPILVAHLGQPVEDPTPGSDPSDDPPTSSDDDRLTDGCYPPLPYCPTALPVACAVSLAVAGELRPEPDPLALALPSATPIRPPRA